MPVELENDGLFYLDYLYLKVSIYRDYLRLPLCEAVNGDYLPDLSKEGSTVIKISSEGTEEEQNVVTPNANFMKFVDDTLGLGGKIEEFVIQPKGFPVTDEVLAFINKYSKPKED